MTIDRWIRAAGPARPASACEAMQSSGGTLARLLAVAMCLALSPVRAAVPTALPRTVSQGQLVILHLPAGSTARLNGVPLHVGADGRAVFGAGRDEAGPLRLTLSNGKRASRTVRISVTPSDWPIERVNGVPPKTVNPPPRSRRALRASRPR